MTLSTFGSVIFVFSVATIVVILAILVVSILMPFRRFDRVKVVEGFYQGYGGCVLDKRWFLWYSLVIGGKQVYLPRWHLSFIPKSEKGLALHEKVRNKMITNDRKRDKAHESLS